MAFFRTIGVEKGSILTYKVKGGLVEVKDVSDLAFFRSDESRFQELTSEQVASAKKGLATKSDDSKKESSDKEEKKEEEGKKGKVKRTAKKPEKESDK